MKDQTIHILKGFSEPEATAWKTREPFEREALRLNRAAKCGLISEATQIKRREKLDQKFKVWKKINGQHLRAPFTSGLFLSHQAGIDFIEKYADHICDAGHNSLLVLEEHKPGGMGIPIKQTWFQLKRDPEGCYHYARTRKPAFAQSILNFA
jgi:hypothetical protein